jgi:hypothetical protein
MDEHECDGDRERDPVLVEEQQGHHDEEVEVTLDRAVREVDDEGGRGQQPGGHERARELSSQAAAERRRQSEGADHRRLDRAVAGAVAETDAEDEDADHVRPQHDEQTLVAGGPGVVRQRAAVRKGEAEAFEHGRGSAGQAGPRPAEQVFVAAITALVGSSEVEPVAWITRSGEGPALSSVRAPFGGHRTATRAAR